MEDCRTVCRYCLFCCLLVCQGENESAMKEGNRRKEVILEHFFYGPTQGVALGHLHSMGKIYCNRRL
jgi:hypothetical protein